MEAFEGLEQQFTYSVVGHSGSGPEALPLIGWGAPPTTPQEKLKLVESELVNMMCDEKVELVSCPVLLKRTRVPHSSTSLTGPACARARRTRESPSQKNKSKFFGTLRG